nr:unnamed protein product [Spirometra erinaceieuropaei]
MSGVLVQGPDASRSFTFAEIGSRRADLCTHSTDFSSDTTATPSPQPRMRHLNTPPPPAHNAIEAFRHTAHWLMQHKIGQHFNYMLTKAAATTCLIFSQARSNALLASPAITAA